MDHSRLIPLLLALSMLSASSCAQPQKNTVRYNLKMEDLKYVYGPFPPVATVNPGEIIETNTVDADGHAVEKAGIKVRGPNPLTGPCSIVGAEPGDTLVVRFLTVDVDGTEGWGSTVAGFGAL